MRRTILLGGVIMSATRFLVLLLPTALSAGCTSRDEGFTLPLGDADRGRAAFIAFRCLDCHDVHNVELPPRTESEQAIVKLGGEVTRVKRYGDLVTGIINPSHRLAEGYTPSEQVEDGKSPMKVYNDVMTVAQLVDIVTFLQQHYPLRPYEPTPYPSYFPQ
jgi:sulfur-oxidizing protein SoxX